MKVACPVWTGGKELRFLPISIVETLNTQAANWKAKYEQENARANGLSSQLNTCKEEKRILDRDLGICRASFQVMSNNYEQCKDDKQAEHDRAEGFKADLEECQQDLKTCQQDLADEQVKSSALESERDSYKAQLDECKSNSGSGSGSGSGSDPGGGGGGR